MEYPLNTVNSEEPHHNKQCPVLEDVEDDDSIEILGSSPPCPTPSSLKSKIFDVCVDQQTLNKSYNPPALQHLFKGPKLKQCINLSDEETLHQSNGADDLQVAVRSTRDIGVQVNGIELNSSADVVKLHFPDEENRRPAKTVRKKQKIGFNANEESSALQEEEAKMRFRFYGSASVRKRTVTDEEREKTIDAAKAYEPSNPFCRVVMRPSYLYTGCILYFPSYFAKEYLSEVSGFIQLQVSDGRNWPVRCLYKGGRAKLSQGWYEFSLANNLGEGDVCVFELINMNDVLLKVSIFRVV